MNSDFAVSNLFDILSRSPAGNCAKYLKWARFVLTSVWRIFIWIVLPYSTKCISVCVLRRFMTALAEWRKLVVKSTVVHQRLARLRGRWRWRWAIFSHALLTGWADHHTCFLVTFWSSDGGTEFCFAPWVSIWSHVSVDRFCRAIVYAMWRPLWCWLDFLDPCASNSLQRRPPGWPSG